VRTVKATAQIGRLYFSQDKGNIIFSSGVFYCYFDPGLFSPPGYRQQAFDSISVGLRRSQAFRQMHDHHRDPMPGAILNPGNMLFNTLFSSDFLFTPEVVGFIKRNVDILQYKTGVFDHIAKVFFFDGGIAHFIFPPNGYCVKSGFLY
jgi:hypothetical protein